MNKKLIVILGPTACGKTKLAARLAAKYNGEIVSADSRQVYRGMDIGTGKDLKDYAVKFKIQINPLLASPFVRGRKIRQGRGIIKKIPHHLIDVVNPMTEFNVAKYQKMAYRAIDDILKKGKQPFLVGGTGLYIDAVVKGFWFQKNTKTLKHKNTKTQKQKNKLIREELSPLILSQLLARLKRIDLATYKIIDKNNRRRVQRALEIYYETGRPKSELPENKKPPYEILILGVKFPPKEIYKKIDSRLELWFKEGMINEVKKLRKRGVSWKRLEDFGLEYRWVARYLQQKINYKELAAALKKAIHNFAKRQITWFKRNEEIIWLENYHQAEEQIKWFLKK
ncbi:MAG: tRNA (adenosine(37)-N6)-dimethylallyltransferase MiaA [Patescibacteria group bacterium]